MRAFHFCAEFNESPGVMHVYAGVITTDADPFRPEFYDKVKDAVAAKMDPPRPSDRVVIRALSLLAQQ